MPWQVDFYRRPLKDSTGQSLWELLICDPSNNLTYEALCPQSEANANWLFGEFQKVIASQKNQPEKIQVFRPQSLSLIETAAQKLGIAVEATRRTESLKTWLKARQYSQSGESFDPIALEKPPPIALPEQLWGEKWRFATLMASDIEESFAGQPIPILEMPQFLLPINLGIASTLPVPGVVIDGGKQSLRLARWIQESRPVSLNYIPGAPDGLILETGLVDRWIVATFADEEVTVAAQIFEQRKQETKGLHFLLVQPDDSGMTYSGFWLLQNVAE
ncbi:Tab2/Atab2 family RNA-binding protein [Phormidium sp. LEGE 05292]|uniref:Tab2/Atab2 family RNA-binding protein n=1 Tax=[Phormidium] sp. LEGE 05292 TaxID=767427 RepID=UPI0018802851|nr:Tab2/Atab2 family RNA-binding protein [Phormidium sp. LEGE 05292]MBE9227587.1 Tab2/Atab2 family RNA-binding protein [Phormidium sp. LEGE 05292]